MGALEPPGDAPPPLSVPSARALSSPRNPAVAHARSLRRRGPRDRERLFLVEGPTAVGEAVSTGAPLVTVFLRREAPGRAAEVAARAARAGVEVVEVGDRALAAMSDATSPQGVVAVARFVDEPPGPLLDRAEGLCVVLADVRDPGNVGTILRSAWAVGAAAVLLGAGTADPYNPKVVRSSAGALFHVPLARGVALPWALAELGARGFRRVAADPHAGAAYDEVDLTGRCALLFGNEAWGVPEGVLTGVDDRATIPMQGQAESLNVGAAAAVFLFEAARQRRQR